MSNIVIERLISGILFIVVLMLFINFILSHRSFMKRHGMTFWGKSKSGGILTPTAVGISFRGCIEGYRESRKEFVRTFIELYDQYKDSYGKEYILKQVIDCIDDLYIKENNPGIKLERKD